MHVTAQIACDLLNPARNLVEAVRGDWNARAVACRLLADGIPWTAPEAARVRVFYTLPDGTPGLYEALPDGSPAGTISGSTVTILLPDPILAAVGCSAVSVMLLDESGAQLSTFPFRVRVSGGSDLQNPATWPQLGAEFEGLMLFVAGGVVTPLKLGPGLSIRDGVLYVAGGAGEPEVPVGAVTTEVVDGDLRVYLDGVEVAPVVDASGDLTWPGLALVVDEAGDATLNVKED